MRLLRASVALAVCQLGCQSLDRFDTKDGAAYCGAIESSQFVWTIESEGGFSRLLRLKLELDTAALDTSPGKITTDDAADGPCKPSATFDHAALRVTPEVVRDSLSLMTFDDGQVHNVIAWVGSSCRGSMLSVVSLYKTDRVDVRILKPVTPNATGERDAFALFPLDRREAGCGF
jgi:hypothetical protein